MRERAETEAATKVANFILIVEEVVRTVKE